MCKLPGHSIIKCVMTIVVWDLITYLFTDINGAVAKVWEWIISFILHFTGHFTSMLGSKLFCIGERDLGYHCFKLNGKTHPKATFCISSSENSSVQTCHLYTKHVSQWTKLHWIPIVIKIIRRLWIQMVMVAWICFLFQMDESPVIRCRDILLTRYIFCYHSGSLPNRTWMIVISYGFLWHVICHPCYNLNVFYLPLQWSWRSMDDEMCPTILVESDYLPMSQCHCWVD